MSFFDKRHKFCIEGNPLDGFQTVKLGANVWTARSGFHPHRGNRASRDRAREDVKEASNGLVQGLMESSQKFRKVDLNKEKISSRLERKACSTIEWLESYHASKGVGARGIYSRSSRLVRSLRRSG